MFFVPKNSNKSLFKFKKTTIFRCLINFLIILILLILFLLQSPCFIYSVYTNCNTLISHKREILNTPEHNKNKIVERKIWKFSNFEKYSKVENYPKVRFLAKIYRNHMFFLVFKNREFLKKTVFAGFLSKIWGGMKNQRQ